MSAHTLLEKDTRNRQRAHLRLWHRRLRRFRLLSSLLLILWRLLVLALLLWHRLR